MAVVIIRRTRHEWDLSNSILGRNEIGQESNTSRIKLGDGITPWIHLKFVDDSVQLSIERLTPDIRELLEKAQSAVQPSDLANAVSSIVGGAPSNMNTLDEIAAALGDNSTFAATVAANLASKADLVAGKVPLSELSDVIDGGGP